MTTTWTNDMTPSITFWDKVARKYAKSKIADEAAYQKTLQRVTEHLGPNDKVLELGAGTGSTALLLAGSVKSYLSTDFAPGMMEIAEEKLVAARAEGNALEGLSFLAADGFDPRLTTAAGDEGFDAVLAFNFLHLVQGPEALLDRVNGLLKPGGLFISKTVCLKSKAWLYVPMIKVMQLFGKAPYVSVLSTDMVNDMMTKAGFEIIETGLYPAPSSHFVVARKV